MHILLDQLRKLGLNNYESKIFALLLEHSPASASFLAKQAKLPRSSTYTTLSSLVEKGLVATTYENEVKQFIAQDYTLFEQLLQTKKQQVLEQFNVLESMKDTFALLKNNSQHAPKVVFFEGQEGLKKIYSSMLRESKKNAILYIVRNEFVWQPDWEFVFQEDWHERVKRFQIEKNIETQLLINPSKIEKEHQDFYNSRKAFSYKFLPKNFLVKNFAVYIMDDIISILSIENNNLIGIKITNQNLADNFKNIFKIVWSIT